MTGASGPAWLQPSVRRVRSPHGHLFVFLNALFIYQLGCLSSKQGKPGQHRHGALTREENSTKA